MIDIDICIILLWYCGSSKLQLIFLSVWIKVPNSAREAYQIFIIHLPDNYISLWLCHIYYKVPEELQVLLLDRSFILYIIYNYTVDEPYGSNQVVFTVQKYLLFFPHPQKSLLIAIAYIL